MHDNIILHHPNIILFISNAFFLFTLNNQYIVRKFHYTIISALIGIYFTSTWHDWQVYVSIVLGIIFGFLHSLQTQKEWKRANSTFIVYFNVILPIYSVGLFPLVIPQTDIAMGVLLALLLWIFVSIFFFIFYKNHAQILDRHIIASSVIIFIFTAFLHRWFWINFSLTLTAQVLFLGIRYV